MMGYTIGDAHPLNIEKDVANIFLKFYASQRLGSDDSGLVSLDAIRSGGRVGASGTGH